MNRADRIAPCPECGTETYKRENYDRIAAEKFALYDRYKKQAANHALLQAEWDLKEIRLVESMKSLQRKVGKQAQVIKRLEEKLRKLKAQPYAEDDHYDVVTMDGKVTRLPPPRDSHMTPFNREPDQEQEVLLRDPMGRVVGRKVEPMKLLPSPCMCMGLCRCDIDG